MSKAPRAQARHPGRVCQCCPAKVPCKQGLVNLDLSEARSYDQSPVDARASKETLLPDNLMSCLASQSVLVCANWQVGGSARLRDYWQHYLPFAKLCAWGGMHEASGVMRSD